ncbi:Cystathionine gamma-lyase [Marinithermus hydrothermalis DSM 14884]|uniref:Cystathionine gamma-lyase n=1 Tax=Marinithermus hydrothermalis (strain DSM 14884 / JCM 11576 / T1) TaxID=869210 RepID=F2NQ73_MARHT|nr:Cystathionine gamma-lyase [Marinithermus hydrothermalis DSM 14884]
MEETLGFATLAVHAGQEPDPETGAVIPPIHLSSTFQQPAPGEPRRYEYSRTQNPTREALEAQIAALEGARWGLAFASGMAAVDAVAHLLRPGDRVVLMNDVYGGTYRYFARVLADWGVTPDFRDLTDPETWAFAGARMVWVETPTNPFLRVVDLAAVAEAARKAGALLVVDNTFASPYLTRPLELGADLVVHSATKYLGGHSDLVLGVVLGRDEALRERLAFYQNSVGAVPGPFEAWLCSRGLKTLALRMERHSETAQALAAWLAAHPRVRRVHYPGLPTHPNHAVAARQMRRFGGMLSIELESKEAAVRFVKALRLFTLAESLGGVESLVSIPGLMTHASLKGTPFEVPERLVRLSVGVEDLEDLRRDLEAALERV